MLELANDKYSLGFELGTSLIGGAAIDKHGVPLADRASRPCPRCDARYCWARRWPGKWDTIERDIRPGAAC